MMVSCTRRMRNYLRARGEYRNMIFFHFGGKELPPRTRRIRLYPCHGTHDGGTTSAHAENTCTPAFPVSDSRNYLRARGEYAIHVSSSKQVKELPPRTRRIHRFGDADEIPPGTTSAHAENTIWRPHL